MTIQKEAKITFIRLYKMSLFHYIKKQKEKFVQFFGEREFYYIEGDLEINIFCNEYGFCDETIKNLSRLEEADRVILIYKYGAGYSVKNCQVHR